MASTNPPARIFVKTNPTTGAQVVREAHTPADAVRFKFDGFVERRAAPAVQPAAAKQDSVAKPAPK